MEHEDVEQLQLDLPGAKGYWWTFCACGLAFRGNTSQRAYDAWEQHEAEA